MDDTESPSCQGCRKRKLKCSRDRPACLHCNRLGSDCVYDLVKNKPGLKPGAVESLSRRVEVLERALLQTRQDDEARATTPAAQDSASVIGVLSLLAKEIQKLSSGGPAAPPPPTPGFAPTVASPASTASGRRTTTSDQGHADTSGARKRRRIDSCGRPYIELSVPLHGLDDSVAHLPSANVLEETISVYFSVIQPWIPILHDTQFRRRLHDPDEFPRLLVVLHAMVVAALRFVEMDGAPLSVSDVAAQVDKSRKIVLLNAMDQLAIGNGDASKAWSLVGSLTRTVEYLQLSVESDAHEKQPLLKPLTSLPPPHNWTEEEERRRVFWNVFNLDRFCSVTTGWNTSLTSDDVHRRLPADGGLWHKEEPVVTPYFGIWDRSAARIGNSITFLPAHFPNPDAIESATQQPESPMSAPSRVSRGSTSVDMSTVGAFAYCIEATESLSRVTTYFLQQKINFKDRQEVSSWLTRFKELDLRLVHWKMFLPQKWQDSNISRQPALIDMDPNLTLAHVTHNTSMILLHQRIAYPHRDWSTELAVKLPSACSAETCQVAAVETNNITQKYLRYTPDRSPVASQFVFCVFISARVLLVHWRHANGDLLPEFWSLVESLEAMARRWIGPLGQQNPRSRQSLAATYAAELRELHHCCVSDPRYTVDVLGYSDNKHAQRPAQSLPGQLTETHDSPDVMAHQQGTANNTATGSIAGTTPRPVDGPGIGILPYPAREAETGDELSAISHMLMDQRFLEMDRIISFDDVAFAARNIGVEDWGKGTYPGLA
ncbi:hypothetical protein GQ53DRAFT_731327 [Thozetella sp. PMI_491]|nr:hypothetical protein GQ53DRAFT_731327 [Thozetella sp. PMI_491]